MRFPSWQRWVLPAVLALATAGAYLNSLGGPFVFDDEHITRNHHIRRLWPVWDAARAPRDSTLSRRPVTTFTFGLNYAVSGSHVTSYRVFNVATHIAAGLALLGLLRRTLAAIPALSPRAAEWLAAAVAGLWMLHPLQTDTVTYLVQRTEGLMALFYLLTLYCSIRGFNASGPRRRWWYAGAVLCCGLGMGSKEVMVSAPLFVLLYDRTLVSGGFGAALKRSPALYAGLAATWVLLAAFVLSSPDAHNTNLFMPDLTPWHYLMTQAGVLVHYLRLALWPSPLVLDYYDWPVARSLGEVPVTALVLIPSMLAATAWLVVRRSPAALPAALLFMVLAPTSSILPMRGEVAAERRMYLPLAGVLSLSVVGAFVLARRAAERRTAAAPSPDAAPAASPAAPAALWWGGRGLVGAAALACLVGTVRRNADYRSSVSIFTDTVEKRPGNARAWNNLGTAWVAARRLDLALECFTRSAGIGGVSEAPGNLGLVLCDLGRQKEALPFLLVSLRVRENNPWGVYYNVGGLFMAQGRVDEAAPLLAEAARLAPGQPAARAGYGFALVRQGKTEQALAEVREAHRLRPGWPAPMVQLAWVLSTHPDARFRDAAEAVRLAERARELTGGDDPTVLNVLAAAYAEAGRSDEAVRVGLQAGELADKAGQTAMARDFRGRVDAFYRAGRPFREGAATARTSPAGEQGEARITEP